MAPDDFAVGIYVTVLSWKPREVETMGSFVGASLGEGWKAPETRVVQNRSFVGELLRIDAVDLPFVAVDAIRGFMGRPYASVLDTRECELKRLSPAMVRAHPDWQKRADWDKGVERPDFVEE